MTARDPCSLSARQVSSSTFAVQSSLLQPNYKKSREVERSPLSTYVSWKLPAHSEILLFTFTRPSYTMRLRSATTTTTTTTTQLLTRTISSLGKQTKTRTASKSILSASSKKSTSKTAKKREHITAHYEDNTKQEIDVKLEEVEIKTEEESKPSHRDNWKEAWDLINDFRQSDQGRADVDVMGCAVLGRTEFGRKVFRFETLVALMLSAQTADKHLAPVLRKLQSMAPEGLTPDALITMGKKTLEEHLRPIGMQDKKSK